MKFWVVAFAFFALLSASVLEHRKTLKNLSEELLHSEILKDPSKINGSYSWLSVSLELFHLSLSDKSKANIFTYLYKSLIDIKEYHWLTHNRDGWPLDRMQPDEDSGLENADIKCNRLIVYFNEFNAGDDRIEQLKSICLKLSQLAKTILDGLEPKVGNELINLTGSNIRLKENVGLMANLRKELDDHRSKTSFRTNEGSGLMFLRHFYPKLFNLEQSLKSKEFLISNPDVHFYLLFTVRLGKYPISGLDSKDIAHFNLNSLKIAFLAHCKTIEGGFEIIARVIYLTAKELAQSSLNQKRTFEFDNAFSGFYFLTNWVVQLNSKVKSPQDCSLVIPIIDCLAVLIARVVPGAVFKRVTKATWTQRHVQSVQHRLGDLETYHLQSGIKSRMLPRMLEIIRMCLETVNLGLKEVPEIVAYDSSKEIKRCFHLVTDSKIRSASNNAQALMQIERTHIFIEDTLLKTKGDPKHKISRKIRQDNYLLFQIIFEPESIYEDHEQACQDLLREDKIVKTSKRRKRNNRKKKTVDKEEPCVVEEVDFDTEEVIQPAESATFSLTETLKDLEESLEEVISVSEYTDNTSVTTTSSQEITALEIHDLGHITILVNRKERYLSEHWDPRYIAYSYLMIGNYVKKTYIDVFLAKLAAKCKNLPQIFNQSLANFKTEIEYLETYHPTVLSEVFFESYIPYGVDFLFSCVDWYARRLRIAHQYLPSSPALREQTAKLFLSMLYNSSGRNVVESNLEAFGFDPSEDLKIFPYPCVQPNECPHIERINAELSILALHGFFMTGQEARMSGGTERVNLWDCRNFFAHQCPKASELRFYIEKIYADHADRKFLSLLLSRNTNRLTL